MAATATRRKPPNWLDRLSAERRAEIESIKADWIAGTIPSSALGLAESLVSNCRALGIPICGVAGVRAWLAKH